MPRRRLVLLVLATLVTIGGVASVGGYAWYLRSDVYRQRCILALQRSLGLPCDIGEVVPRSRTAREFRDVTVWLPERRDRALFCKSAVVLRPDPGDRHLYDIQLSGGVCEVSTRTWLRRDYRTVVESGLRPGFAPGGPRKVTFDNMNISLVRDRFQAELRGSAGVVEFKSPREGRASLMCKEFNGFQTETPVVVSLRFSPHDHSIRLDEVELIAPNIPLRVADLGDLAGVNISSGEFSGQLSYQENDAGRSLTVSGICFNIDLAEWTAGLTLIPWRGRSSEIELQELRVENGEPARLRFRGALADVSLGDILGTWGLEGVSGTLALEVGAADVSRDGVRHFAAGGRAKGISLESLTEAIGLGKMTGELSVVITGLTIENNRLKSLDATLRVADADNPPNWIEGRLLSEIINRALKIEMPSVLPDRVEFTRFGVRLEIRDEVLYLFGTHGENEETILTARLFGRDMPLIIAPRRSFDLGPWFDRLRAEARRRLQGQFRRKTPPTTP